MDFYRAFRNEDGSVKGCIDLVESFDDDGWYAHEFDFTRTDNATRVSHKIYKSKAALIVDLEVGKHRWKKWD